MTALTLWVPRLEANRTDRTLAGLLLPFNTEGRTNLGRLTAGEDSALEAAESVHLNVEHDPRRPIGTLTTLERTSEGLRATFAVVETREGDDALTEAAAGLRAGLSIELEPIVTRAGKIISGTIAGAGLVARPAFPTARLAAAEGDPMVPDQGELPDVVIDGKELDDVTAVEVAPTRIEITTRTEPESEPEPVPATLAASEHQEETMTAATVQNAALVAASTEKDTSAKALFAAFAEAGRTRLNAALSDVVSGDIVGQSDTQPQYVGELWDGKAYERRYIPLFNHAELSSFKIAGWKWVTKPTVARYAGDKTAIPSNAVETEPAESEAFRIAGGWDVDRKFRDFSNTEFWESFFKAMTESYAKVSDTEALDFAVANAPAVARGTVPSGVAPGLVSIVDGVLAILDKTETVANFALVAKDLWRAMLFTRSDDALAYLNAALGFEDGQLNGFKIMPAPLAAGTTLVGCKAALTVHELPGSPIRVEAVDVAKGGIDEALFGYEGFNLHDADGLALVSGA